MMKSKVLPKIKLKVLKKCKWAHPNEPWKKQRVFKENEIYDISNEMAHRMIETGYAVLADNKDKTVVKGINKMEKIEYDNKSRGRPRKAE